MDSYAIIIENVQKFPWLYDKRNKHFKNKLMKENAWETIAGIAEDSPGNVESTWNMIRNRYCQEKRKIRCIPSGSQAVPTWKYFRVLSFLDEHIIPRRTSTNVKTPEPEPLVEDNSQIEESQNTENLHQSGNESERDILEVEVNAEEPLLASTPISSLQKKNPSYKRKRKDDAVNETINAALQSLTALANQENKIENDEDMLFATSIGHSLKRISNRKRKAACKIKLLQVLEEFED